MRSVYKPYSVKLCFYNYRFPGDGLPIINEFKCQCHSCVIVLQLKKERKKGQSEKLIKIKIKIMNHTFILFNIIISSRTKTPCTLPATSCSTLKCIHKASGLYVPFWEMELTMFCSLDPPKKIPPGPQT